MYEQCCTKLAEWINGLFLERLTSKICIEWNKKLILFQETLDEWINMQKKWMYLETIFSGGDIAKQLPSETQTFVKIDKYSVIETKNDSCMSNLTPQYATKKIPHQYQLNLWSDWNHRDGSFVF